VTDHQFSWDHGRRPGARFPVYTRGNIAEVFPNPMSPLAWSAVTGRYSDQGWRDALETLGAFDRSDFDPEHAELLNWFGGYLYLNLSVLRILAVRAPGMTPELMDAGLLGDHPDVPPHRPHPEDESPEHTERVGETLGRLLTTSTVPEVVADRAMLDDFLADRPDLAGLSDAELVVYLRTAAALMRRLVGTHIVVTLSSSIAVGLVTAVCADGLGDPGLALDVLSGLGGVASAGPSYDLWVVARVVAASPALMAEFDVGIAGLLERVRDLADGPEFLAIFDEVVQRYRFRGPDEYNPTAATWGTRPELALAAVDRMRFASPEENPLARHGGLAAQRERRTAEAVERLAGAPETAGQLRAGITAAGAFLAAREAARLNIGIAIHEIRLSLLELGTRMMTAGHLARWEDLEVLTDDELNAFLADPASFTEAIKVRAAAFAALSELEPPFILDGSLPPLTEWARKGAVEVSPAAPGEILRGMAGCPGTATGTARVVLDPMVADHLEPGDILIAPLTDPAWTPLFVTAAAVVVETGAVISHAVIVCRELGLPCVVSMSHATRRIRDGATITVDGVAGTITVHD
jgi:pyruvate,water dikinase